MMPTDPKLTIYIDPGLRGCGVAVFADGELLHAEYTSSLGGHATPLLEAAAGVEAMIQRLGIVAPGSLGFDLFVVERPKIYDAAHQKGDQKDIADLLIVVGSLMVIGADIARAVLAVEPWEWKGQTPKDVTAQRVDKHLSDDERSRIEWPAKTLRHNVIDAIGIGLSQLGRMGK